MTDPKVIRYVAVVTLYVAAAVVFFEGLGSEKQFLRATSWIPAAIMIVLTAYEKWFWRVGPLGLPILSGTWKVLLTSHWQDPHEVPANHAPREIPGYFVIRQTATSLSVTLYTDESSSVTFATHLRRQIDGQHSLVWVYENTPLVDLAKSPVHFGTVIAQQVSGRKVQQISGIYYTSRNTTGSFHTSNTRNPRRASSLADAKALFNDT